jgi:hypothetical protein
MEHDGSIGKVSVWPAALESRSAIAHALCASWNCPAAIPEQDEWYPQSLCLSRKTPRFFSTRLPDQLATLSRKTTQNRETGRIDARHPPALALQLFCARALSYVRCSKRDTRRTAAAASSAWAGGPGAILSLQVQEQLPTPCAEAFWLFPASEVGVFGGDQCTALQSRWCAVGCLAAAKTMP